MARPDTTHGIGQPKLSPFNVEVNAPPPRMIVCCTGNHYMADQVSAPESRTQWRGVTRSSTIEDLFDVYHWWSPGSRQTAGQTAGIPARSIYKGLCTKQEDGAATVGMAMPEKEHVISPRRPAKARGNQ